MDNAPAQIRGYPDYLVYADGKVFSKKTNRFLKHSFMRSGYPTVELFNSDGSRRVLVHRLVAEAFVPNPKKHRFVNHKDENKSNPSADNLEWCTAEYNQNYGTCKQRRIANTDYTNPVYRENAVKNSMKLRRPVEQLENEIVIAEYESSADAGRKTGLNTTHINECCHGGARKHVGGYGWRFKKEE